MGLLGSECTLQHQHFSSWAMLTCSSWKFSSALETSAEALSTDFPLLCHTSWTAIMNMIMANILTFDVFPLDLPSPATSLLKISTLTSLWFPFHELLARARGLNLISKLLYISAEFRLNVSAPRASLLNLYCRCKLSGCTLRIFATWLRKLLQETIDDSGLRGVRTPSLGSLTSYGTSKVSVNHHIRTKVSHINHTKPHQDLQN